MSEDVIMATVTRHQNAAIQRTLVPLNVLLLSSVLAWIPIDAVALEPDRLATATALRLLAAAGLATLVFTVHQGRFSSCAAAALQFSLLIQILALAPIAMAVDPGRAGLLAQPYQVFPALVLAQIALFPLRPHQVVLPLLGLLVIQFVVLHAAGHAGWDSLLADLWLTALLGAIAVWASFGRMRLLGDLLDARGKADRDPLTKLANRRSALIRLQKEHARHDRDDTPLSLVLIDLDGFKQVNDRHGHEAGDTVLQQVAARLSLHCRDTDLAARWGGEEFLVLLPGATLQRAGRVAESLRAGMAAEPLHCGTAWVRQHFSAGVAELIPGESIQDLIARADVALYSAKRAGRNRVVAADPAHDPIPGR